ncbi:MAG: hypothetical protein ABIE23_01285 [archaeon]
MINTVSYSYERVGKRFLPIIPVAIKNKDKLIETAAYIDSGASVSVFNTIMAEILGIDYKKGKVIYPRGTAGKIKAYSVETILIVANKEIRSEVLFSNELATKFNLIGLKGVFDAFKVTFDNRNKKITFTENR